MKTVFIIAKMIALLSGAFALIALGLLFHRTQIELTPLAGKMGTLLQSATEEFEAARQTTADVDSGVSYEVDKIKKPKSKVMQVVTGIAGVLGAFAKI
jgi:2C-methyl-D-erythritol 2,4-cyclodiphosphate synthase